MSAVGWCCLTGSPRKFGRKSLGGAPLALTRAEP
jgi:hypothetical protein